MIEKKENKGSIMGNTKNIYVDRLLFELVEKRTKAVFINRGPVKRCYLLHLNEVLDYFNL